MMCLYFTLWQLQEKYGYQCLDGVDASRLMLEMARDKGIYQRLYCARLGDGNHLQVLDGTIFV